MTTNDQSPNLYQLHGRGLQVTYSTSGIDGKPHLDYHDATLEHAFVGDEIRTQDTEIGILVSVTTKPSIDSGTTSFSLLVPTVNLGNSASAPISTYGVTTRHRFSLVHALNLGQTELYTVTHLTGTAQIVEF